MISSEIQGTLQALQDDLRAAEELTAQRRLSRDRYLLHLLSEGHSLRSVALSTGMARQSIMEIRDKAQKDAQALPGVDLFQAADGGTSLD